MEELDPKFCLVPFTSFSISPRGILRTCCAQYDVTMHSWENVKDPGNIQWPTARMLNMQEKMRGPDIEKNTPECRYCWASERINLPSYRTNYNEFWINKMGLPAVHDLKQNPKINTLDLQFGHLCNNSCLMCNTSLSSHLYTTKTKLFNNSTDAEQKEFYKFDINYINDHADWTKLESSYNKVIELCKPITEIKISGGEPLFNPKFNDFLEYLVTKEQPLERIHLTTNGTIYNDKSIELINKIKRIAYIKISVESIGAEEEFIRWPTNWEEKVNNIKKIIKNVNVPELGFEISTCIQSLNLFSLDKVNRFIEELRKEFPDKTINKNNQPINHTDIASLFHCDNEYLEYYKTKFNEPVVINQVNLSLAWKEKRTRKQVLYFLDSAKLQGIDIEKVFPIYWEYHKKYI